MPNIVVAVIWHLCSIENSMQPLVGYSRSQQSPQVDEATVRLPQVDETTHRRNSGVIRPSDVLGCCCPATAMTKVNGSKSWRFAVKYRSCSATACNNDNRSFRFWGRGPGLYKLDRLELSLHIQVAGQGSRWPCLPTARSSKGHPQASRCVCVCVMSIYGYCSLGIGLSSYLNFEVFLY